MLQGDDGEHDPEDLQTEAGAGTAHSGSGFARYGVGLFLAALIVVAVVAITITMELKRRQGYLPPPPETTLKWQTRFTSVPTSESYRAALAAYTASEHRAGTDAGHELALWTKAQFEKHGFQVEMHPYSVLLSYPKFLSAKLIFPITHECAVYETPIAGDPTSANAANMPAYNGYSGSGSAVGELIYVNYGRVQDFELLDRRNISVAGRIVIARYGHNFRGIKAMLAEERGAAGVLIYSDPADDGFGRGAVYPDGPWRPEQAIQRGSVQFSQSTYPGDPTTPGQPSLPAAERLPLDKCNIPQIPVQPISYADAAVLLQQLRGALPDSEWQGGLEFAYALGPGPAQFNLTVQHSYTFDPIYNVIGKIEGSGDPSKAVIIGNHRDAWNFGGCDPASGSATLMEVARTFGALLAEGWRPYRTVILASWDAEEQGLIGSTEWVEQYGAALQTSVAAYINVDGGVSGPYFESVIVPSLASAVSSALALVADPTPGQTRTMLDAAIADAKTLDPDADAPIFRDLGSGSDFTPFFQHLGLPAADFGFKGSYGVYHSIYDSFTYMERYGDPGFLRGPAIARFIGVLALSFSEARIMPFNYADYGTRMHEGIVEIRRLMPRIKDAAFAQAIANYVESANHLQAHIEAIDVNSLTRERLAAFNNRLVLAEQQFLLPLGLNGRPFFRHAVFAPGVYTGYEARIFPDLREAVEDGDETQAALEAAKLAQVLNSAAAYLDATRIDSL